MAAIILQDKWRRQPPNGYSLRPEFSQGATVVLPSAGRILLPNGVSPTSDTRQLKPTPQGVAFSGDGTMYAQAPYSMDGATSYAWLAFIESVSNFETRNVFCAALNNDYQYQLRTDGSNWAFYHLSSAPSDILAGEAGGLTLNSPTVLAGKWENGAISLFKNGVRVAGPVTATGAFRTPNKVWLMSDGAGVNPWHGSVYLNAFWAGRSFSDAALCELTSNQSAPWQIFRRPRYLYISLPSGGGATIAGTFSGTDSVDTTSFSGDVLIQGTLAATDATDTTSFSGAVPISGTFSPTESAVDSALFEGNVVTAGVPTLSSPTVVSVTATSAIPRVTVTFA